MALIGGFQAFLSHKYGARCLPTRIIADEFEIMRKEMKNHAELDFRFEATHLGSAIRMENLIEDCYVLDENEIPARYRLKYISSIISTYDSSVSLKTKTACWPGLLNKDIFSPKDKECKVIWVSWRTLVRCDRVGA